MLHPRHKKIFVHVTALSVCIGILMLVAAVIPRKANADSYSWTLQNGLTSSFWQSLASSSDGTKLATGASSGNIYTSTDGGASWTQRTASGNHYWISIASSSDGTKLAAAGFGSYIFTSTDSGVTWTQQTNSGSRNWAAIASSSDGTKLAAAVNSSGYVYTSTDSGVTWTEQTNAGLQNWRSIASSADGTRLVAGANTIWTSADSGATWTERTSAGTGQWFGVTSSSDGLKLTAADQSPGFIVTSGDGGATWAQRTSAGSRTWTSMDASADGQRLLAGVSSGMLYTSSDGGTNWTQETAAGSRGWSAVAASSDGFVLAAVYSPGRVYTGAFIFSKTRHKPARLSIITQLRAMTATPETLTNTRVHVRAAGDDVPGSPLRGEDAPGTTFLLEPGLYVVSADVPAGYRAEYSGACLADGQAEIFLNDEKTCFISLFEKETVVVPPAPPAPSEPEPQAPAPVESPTPVPAVRFLHDLVPGDQGETVRELQMFLNSHGFPLSHTGPGSPGNETIIFGKKTWEALTRFQRAHGIIPAYGRLDARTRELINSQFP